MKARDDCKNNLLKLRLQMKHLLNDHEFQRHWSGTQNTDSQNAASRAVMWQLREKQQSGKQGWSDLRVVGMAFFEHLVGAVVAQDEITKHLFNLKDLALQS